MRRFRSAALAGRHIESLEARALFSVAFDGVDSNGHVFTASTAGTVISIDNVGKVFTDIAENAAGQLFAVDGTSTLYSIDFADSEYTAIGSLGTSVNSLAFSAGGVLYGANSSLFTINTNTGVATSVGPLGGFTCGGDIAFDNTGAIFMLSTNNTLVKVNPATAAATLIGPIGFTNLSSLIFGTDDVLYGISSQTYQVYSLNPQTGVGTFVVTMTGSGPITGAASLPPLAAGTMGLFASTSSVKAGDSVTLTATVGGNNGVAPTGQVNFFSDGVSIGSATLSSGIASFSTIDLPVGMHTITSDYAGDSNYVGSESSNSTVVTVSQAASAVTLSASAHVLIVGQAEMLTVAIGAADKSALAPTGTAVIYQDGNVIGTYPLDATGQIELPYTANAAAPGGTKFTAVYSGDANYLASTSNALSQVFFAPSTASLTLPLATFPAVGVAGQPFAMKVTMLVTNGASVLNGKFTISLYIDGASAGLDSSPAQLFTVNKKLKLNAGKLITVPFKLAKLPLTVPAGVFHLVAKVIDPLGDADIFTSNQVVTVAEPVLALVPTLSALTPTEIKFGKTGAITITLTNAGNIPDVGLVTMSFSPVAGANTVTAKVNLVTIKRHLSLKPQATLSIVVRFRIVHDLLAAMYDLQAVVLFGGVTTTLLGPTFQAG